eukprot:CAMPEP_0181267728 /NCGR_PEP_ID=MMETSP1097-20121128/5083_1 /TAXON_ID=35684 /ORGANISM="Pseudopedinella elastica, Strain CCMP716" /LENGTH=131 /DNA_ID=CAMNT_0023367231 /DNA_START=92 /DNA_END=483 /DNA_ORIENTATION=-
MGPVSETPLGVSLRALKLLMRHLVLVLGLKIERVQVLGRESHGTFFLPRQLLPRANGTAGKAVSERPGTFEVFANLARYKLSRTSDTAGTSDTSEVLAPPDHWTLPMSLHRMILGHSRGPSNPRTLRTCAA